MIETHILPEFANRELGSLTTEEITVWELSIVEGGLSRRTARDARSTFTAALSDAIPKHIQTNPAARKRGKGRKGHRRVERIMKQEKAWPSPLQALLIAERGAALSGDDTDFVMLTTLAYTGMRWSEVVGLPPACIKGDVIDVHWKLYELRSQFYAGPPKDGSMRTVDIPPFLKALLKAQLDARENRHCTCKQRPGSDPRVAWCTGSDFAFLGPQQGHYRRSNYAERVMRPAADGWYPKKVGPRARPSMPVLVDLDGAWPGQPMPPWPANVSHLPLYEPPRARGRRRIPDDAQLASWAPVLSGLTPHGLRHGHQTWMEEARTPEVLKAERMGHEVPGMRGVYAHVSPAMRRELVAVLQGLWESALDARAAIAPRSIVPTLDALLTARQPERNA